MASEGLEGSKKQNKSLVGVRKGAKGDDPARGRLTQRARSSRV
jgi:hypothetical protein